MTVSTGVKHADHARLRQLFRGQPKVRFGLSGHTCLIYRVNAAGVTYFCDGAVNCHWWSGNHLGVCECGYGPIDLSHDETSDHQYVANGLKPVAVGGTDGD